MDLGLAGQHITFHYFILGKQALCMFFGLGPTFGNLNATLAADAFSSTEVTDKHIGLVSGLCNGCAFLHVNGYVIGKKFYVVCAH